MSNTICVRLSVSVAAGLFVTALKEWMEPHHRRSRRFVAVLTGAACLLIIRTSVSAEPAGFWPPLLGPPEALAPEVSAAVERAWMAPTLRRRVHVPSARVPLEVYRAFLDTPDVTAAAARFLKLATYGVTVLDDDRYEADDGDGARGFSQVLQRDPQRRVVFSKGEQTGPILGTVRGYALTVLDLEPRGDWVDAALTAYVYIDDRVAAGLARFLIVSLGALADRKLTEGLRTTAVVAEWAVDPSGSFCEWLAREPLDARRRNRIVAVLPACARAGLPRTGRDPGSKPEVHTGTRAARAD
jgi:hypothetical protein